MKASLAAASVALAVIGAGIAKANAGEDVPGYLAALVRDNVDSVDTSRSVDIGRQLCVQLRRGETVEGTALAAPLHRRVRSPTAGQNSDAKFDGRCGTVLPHA